MLDHLLFVGQELQKVDKDLTPLKGSCLSKTAMEYLIILNRFKFKFKWFYCSIMFYIVQYKCRIYLGC